MKEEINKLKSEIDEIGVKLASNNLSENEGEIKNLIETMREKNDKIKALSEDIKNIEKTEDFISELPLPNKDTIINDSSVEEEHEELNKLNKC